MKFGMNLLLWSGELSDSMLPVLEKLKGMGYDGVEVPIFDPNLAHFEAWGKRIKGFGPGVYGGHVPQRGRQPDQPRRQGSRRGGRCHAADAGVLRSLDARLLCGPYHSAIGEFTGKGPTKDEWKWGVETMQKNADGAAKHRVTLGIEYLNRFECYLLNCAADTIRFVREVGSPHCRMMYDTFHANIEEKHPAQAIRACAEYTVHVHISENDRGTPGEGAVRWQETFDTLKETKYDGWMVIEAFGLALPSWRRPRRSARCTRAKSSSRATAWRS